MSDNSQNFDSLQERNQQVLANISQLQTQEKELYDSLDDPALTSDQKQQIINKINEISQMRLNMYASLNDTYSAYQKNVSASKITLGQEVDAIKIIENELNESKKKLNLIQEEQYNKLRLVEINTYYGKRYDAHVKMMKTIVFTCIPLIILAVLANRGILPNTLYMLLFAVILSIGAVFLIKQIIDASNRDNMNWDEYNWYFDKSKAPTDTTEGTPMNPWATGSLTCVGSACCYEGSVYDEMKNMCVPTSVYEQDYPPSTTNTGTTTDITTTSTEVAATTNDTTTTTTTSATDPTTSTTETFITGRILGKYGRTPLKYIDINSNVMPMNASLIKF